MKSVGASAIMLRSLLKARLAPHGIIGALPHKVSNQSKRLGKAALAHMPPIFWKASRHPHPSFSAVFAYYGARRGWIVVPERLRESKEDYSHPTSALVGALESLSDFKELLKWFDRAENAELRTNKGNTLSEYLESTELSLVRHIVSDILGDAYNSPRFNHKHKFVVTAKSGGEELPGFTA